MRIRSATKREGPGSMSHAHGLEPALGSLGLCSRDGFEMFYGHLGVDGAHGTPPPLFWHGTEQNGAIIPPRTRFRLMYPNPKIAPNGEWIAHKTNTFDPVCALFQNGTQDNTPEPSPFIHESTCQHLTKSTSMEG